MKYKFLNKMISIMGFPIPIISELCIFVDWAIYAVASFALQTFFQLAEISSTIFTDVSNSEVYSTVQSILSRIMVLAGVYALFRLGIMLINLMINPDNTKKVGQTGMDFIKGAIIAVVLLASSKLIFSQLGEFQYLVLNSENRLIPKLIYGTDIENPVTYSDKKEADMFTNRVWSVFFQPRDGYATDGAKKAWENVRNGNATILSMIGRQYNEFDYYPFISGIVGMMLIYYFAIFSVELGARIIKLITLQVLSPIPIIMSVDPSQKSKLNNFFKAYLAIYLQIFVRVFTIYIAFIVLDLIQTVLSDYGSGLLTNSTSSARIMAGNFIIDIIMIFAVFQAAKELPKVVEDALGLKLGIQTSGKGSFGALVGGIVGGGVGATLGGAGALVGAKSSGAGWASAIGTGLLGATRGMLSGSSSGSRGKTIKDKVAGVVGTAKSNYGLGKDVQKRGGVINYGLGFLENKTGAQKRDAKKIEAYEKDMQKQDKQASVFKDVISKENDAIGSLNEQVGSFNRAEELRKRIENSYSDQYGSFSDILAKDESYQIAHQDVIRYAGDASHIADYQAAQLLESDRRNELERGYNAARDDYFKDNIEYMASGSTSVDPEFKKRVDTYNSYMDDTGQSSRKLNFVPGSSSTFTADMTRISKDNKNDIDKLEADIERRRRVVSGAKRQIEVRDDRRKTIERDKKNFMDDPKIKRHTFDNKK